MGSNSSKVISCEEFQVIIDTDLKPLFEEHNKAVEQFLKSYDKWLVKRNEVIDTLCILISELEDRHRNTNIASLTASSVSFVSGAACVAGLMFAPLTSGASAALTAGGIIGSSAGIITTTGVRAIEIGLKLDVLRRASNVVKEDCQETKNLSVLIENCQKHEAKIQNVLRANHCSAFLRDNVDLSDPKIRDRLSVIEKGNETVDDYLILLDSLESDRFSPLKNLQKMEIVRMNSSFVSKTTEIFLSLHKSIINIKRCSIILKNWRSGWAASTFSVVGKFSRFAKGALIGLSMAVDLYDIGSTAKNMIFGERSDDVENLRKIIYDLNQQKIDVTNYYSFVKESFAFPGSKLEMSILTEEKTYVLISSADEPGVLVTSATESDISVLPIPKTDESISSASEPDLPVFPVEVPLSTLPDVAGSAQGT